MAMEMDQRWEAGGDGTEMEMRTGTGT